MSQRHPLMDAIGSACGSKVTEHAFWENTQYTSQIEFFDRLWHYASDEQKQAVPQHVQNMLTEKLYSSNAPLFQVTTQKEELLQELSGVSVRAPDRKLKF